MMEKSKRGNGSTLMYVSHTFCVTAFLSRPYMNYLSHITKVNNIRPSVDSHQNESVEQMKETLNN
jgi:hypothetical protein